MTRNRALLVLLVTAACGGSAAKLETQTFALKYMSPGQARDLIDPYVYHERSGAPGALSVSDAALTVRETHDNLERIARALAEFDTPRPMIRLTFRLIRADGTPGVGHDSEITDVEAILRKLFAFRGYRLVGEGVISGIEGSQVSQMLGGAADRYELGAEIERVTGRGDSAMVQLQVRLNLYPGAFQTRVGVPIGKTAVLGNVQGGRGKTTLILTVQPEIVNASP